MSKHLLKYSHAYHLIYYWNVGLLNAFSRHSLVRCALCPFKHHPAVLTILTPRLGDLAPWVANNAADRMPDDGELRGSLDDFYTVQAGGEVLGLDTSLIDSLDNDPRSMRPVS